MTDDVLPLTGERTVPGVAVENYWFRRHQVVYELLAPLCTRQKVLEAGCGEGYGADLLRHSASEVLALDYDAGTTSHVHRRYPALSLARANLASLPVRSAAVDVVVNLQVIEHLWNQPEFLRECHRVLTPGGVLVVSTPNRITFSPGRDTPLNPFHTRELAAAELLGLLEDAGFGATVSGLHHGARLRGLDEAHGGSLVDAQIGGAPWSVELHADVASITTDDFVLSESDVDASLDLVAIGTRR